ncbi:hypothetical protein Trco_008443 [Trichoderma cornu-damae]|uniref:Uncharacterized protein n=1 Tax=Trichoderma cornu-damae TaxID=654480 RepID=A0A9P8TSZ5_9HYPO|nr:hypothetical protein Trco_008443 [Trichoderma cornu-damae]
MKRIADFLRSISLRPELGRYVRELNFSTFSSFQLEEDHLKAFADAAARLGVSLDDGVEELPYEVMVQLTIAQTPNVRVIGVTAYEVYSHDGIGAFTLLEEIAAQSPARVSLPHLRRLFLGHDHHRRISLGYFGGIIQLAPCIREVAMKPCYGLNYAGKDMKDEISLKNVTTLRLNGGHITKSELEWIIRLCGELEVFEYKHHSIYFSLDTDCVTPREVMEILKPHRNTLRSISLDLGRRARQGSDDFDFSRFCAHGDKILSLKNYSQLEKLQIDGSSVLFPEAQTPGYRTDILTELLPISIRRFYLTNAQKEATANMITLANSIAKFPLLKYIVLTGNSIEGPLGDIQVIFDKGEIDILRKVLKDNGVRFEVVGEWPNP